MWETLPTIAVAKNLSVITLVLAIRGNLARLGLEFSLEDLVHDVAG
jgi:hypothetical protein